MAVCGDGAVLTTSIKFMFASLLHDPTDPGTDRLKFQLVGWVEGQKISYPGRSMAAPKPNGSKHMGIFTKVQMMS